MRAGRGAPRLVSDERLRRRRPSARTRAASRATRRSPTRSPRTWAGPRRTSWSCRARTATGSSGVWKGFAELLALGLVKTGAAHDRGRAVRPARPRHRRAGSRRRRWSTRRRRRWPSPSARATAPGRGSPPCASPAGSGVRVTDEGIFEAQRALAREEGLFVGAVLGGGARRRHAARRADGARPRGRPSSSSHVQRPQGSRRRAARGCTDVPDAPAPTSTRLLAHPARALWTRAGPLASAWRSWATDCRRAPSAWARAAERRRARQPVDHRGLLPPGRLRAGRRGGRRHRARDDRPRRGEPVHAAPRAAWPWRRRRSPASRPAASCSASAASNRRWIDEQMAIPFKTPLRGLREGVEIVRRLLAGERVTFAGECFSVDGVALETPPPRAGAHLLGRQGPAGAGAGRRDRRRRSSARSSRRRPTSAGCGRDRGRAGRGRFVGPRVRPDGGGRRRRAAARGACARCSRATSACSTASPSSPTPA